MEIFQKPYKQKTILQARDYIFLDFDHGKTCHCTGFFLYAQPRDDVQPVVQYFGMFTLPLLRPLWLYLAGSYSVSQGILS